jgi:hypothetical protein
MTYYWDFFGPDAQRTADHFLRHLLTFLMSSPALDGCRYGVLSLSEGHAAAWCAVPSDAAGALVEQRLRPRRATEHAPDEARAKPAAEPADGSSGGAGQGGA